ncbi:uncharacterized protein LOC132737763 [Ruditapes philippinarum]|uniref:uncharacterized protein LOC132737763 n=1 Tax=Ruditapes philippinarum TaxID=129788 RepID=UPI00295A6D0E|nr:uncharacterized protein LOC132737763 [Ruditapes philippinarum]
MTFQTEQYWKEQIFYGMFVRAQILLAYKLQDSTGYWESLIFEKIDSATRSLLSANMCTQELQSCVNNMMNNFVDCSLYPKMQITTQVMQLICDLKENKNLTSTCYKEVLITLHVTIADVLRNGDNVENEVSTCQSPEAYMAKRLICAEVACPKESKTFHSFTPWSWFMSVEDDLMIECKLTPSSCDVPEQTGTPVNGNVVTTTGKQAPQLEVKPQEENTATSGTSSFTTSQYSSSTTWPESSTSYPPEDEKCYTDAVFQNFCPVPDDMADVSFWDLYSVFFSDSVLDALMIGCTKGSWCLKDKFDYWQSLIVERVDMVMHSEIAESMCRCA